jgi:hypothetical protein
MVETVKTEYVFNKSENPDLKMLETQNINTPEGYEGVSKNVTLANLFAYALNNGVSWGRLLAPVGLPEEGFNGAAEEENVAKLYATINRFVDVKWNTVVSLYWSLYSTLDFKNEETYYRLAEHYTHIVITFGNELYAPSFNTLYQTILPAIQKKKETSFIPTSNIIEYLLLNRALREEGVVLPMADVFQCSVIWTGEDIFKLLRNGKSLTEALSLHEIGFKTVDEVIVYAGAIPETWIDLILN